MLKAEETKNKLTQTINDKGELVKPLAGIGYQRLIGMATTSIAVPTAVVEGAKVLLTRMRFDIEGDIYQQFRQRIIEKHNVDIDNLPKRKKSSYNGATRNLEYQRWYNQNVRKR